MMTREPSRVPRPATTRKGQRRWTACDLCRRISLACFAVAAGQAFNLGFVHTDMFWWGGVAAGLFFHELGEVLS